MTTFKEQLAIDMANIMGNQDEAGELHNIDGEADIACVFETVRAEPSGFETGFMITKCLIIPQGSFPGKLFLGRTVSVDGDDYTIGDFNTFPVHYEIYMSRYSG